MEVERFPARPWPSFMGVSLLASVSATRRAPTRPPTAIAAETATAPAPGDSAEAPTTRPRIFGVSLSPRANPTTAALVTWPAVTADCAETPAKLPT